MHKFVRICFNAKQCRVIAQPCCSLAHALLHVCQATLKKAEYDDHIIFYAVWCPLERQYHKDLTVEVSLVKQQPFSLCFCKCMLDFKRPLASEILLWILVCSNEVINLLTEIQSSEIYLLYATCISARRSLEITRFTHLTLFQIASWWTLQTILL